MLQLINKSEYWSAAISAGEQAQLRFADVLAHVATAKVSGFEMARIGHIASGYKLSLSHLHNQNDIFEISGAHLQTLARDRTFSSPALPAAKSLDAIISVGWLSSVPDTEIKDLTKAVGGMVKHGGLILHTFEFVIEERPSKYWSNRFNAIRDVFGSGILTPLGEVMRELVFACDAASVSDNELFQRRKWAPELDNLRMRSQTVGLVLAGRCF